MPVEQATQVSFFERGLFGLQVTGIGMIVVFAGLLILIACILVLGRAVRGTTGAPAKAPPFIPEPEPEPVAEAEDAPDECEIIAAIAAAIAACAGDGRHYIARTVRKLAVPKAAESAWAQAGRMNQVNRRL